MLKSAIVAAIFFAAGFIFSGLIKGESVDMSAATSAPVARTESLQSVNEPRQDLLLSQPATKDDVKLSRELPKLRNLANPENSYEAFRILVALDQYSAAELKELLLNTSKDKKELRSQIVFLLVSKFPQEGFALLGDALNQNDTDLAKSILQASSQSNPNMTWEWLQKNESDFDKVFGQGGAKKTFKMQVLTALSKKPEYKFLVAEEVQRLAQAGTSGAENYFLEVINKNIASADPEASVNTALASVGGKLDKDLFKGGVLAIADKDLARAKDLVIQNPAFADASLVRQLSSKLIEKNQFGDVYALINKLPDPNMQRTAAATAAYEVSQQGIARSVEFVNALESEELKTSTVMSMSASMSANGQPMRDQLSLFDEALKNVPVQKKAFNYAYTINNWSKKDAAASSQYLTELSSTDKPLADEVQKALDRLKKNASTSTR